MLLIKQYLYVNKVFYQHQNDIIGYLSEPFTNYSFQCAVLTILPTLLFQFLYLIQNGKFKNSTSIQKEYKKKTTTTNISKMKRKSSVYP